MPTEGVVRTGTWAAATESERAGQPAAARGVYSIGVVSSMLGVPPATLRTWEERYAVVSPERTRGGHRLYSRTQIEQLRLVVAETASGVSAADAHRWLAQRLLGGDTAGEGRAEAGRPRVLILIAERDAYSAELIEFLLRTEGFGVEVTLEAEEARRRFQVAQPDMIIVEFLLGGAEGEALCRWLKEGGAGRVLVISELDAADRALRAGADAFLRKPIGQLTLVSVVKDLLGLSAIIGQRSDR